jgi:hypothetical protein
MTISLTIVLLIMAIAMASALTYALARRAFRRSVAELREATSEQVSSLRRTVNQLETGLAELRRRAPGEQQVFAAAAPTIGAAPASAAAEQSDANREGAKVSEEEVSAETLVMIAAAVTSFLGKRVRIRSAKMLQSPYEIVNPWAQQGRVFVQASHNLRSRG